MRGAVCGRLVIHINIDVLCCRSKADKPGQVAKIVGKETMAGGDDIEDDFGII